MKYSPHVHKPKKGGTDHHMKHQGRLSIEVVKCALTHRDKSKITHEILTVGF